MLTIKYILFCIALNMPLTVTLRHNSVSSGIKSIAGLGISTTMCVIHTALTIGGLYLGMALRFEPSDLNDTTALALLVVVAAKLCMTTFSKQKQPIYDLSKPVTVFTLCIALGMNSFIAAMGLGMCAENSSRTILTLSIATTVLSLFFSELGIMLGCQDKGLREKKFMTVAILLYLAAIGWHVVF